MKTFYSILGCYLWWHVAFGWVYGVMKVRELTGQDTWANFWQNKKLFGRYFICFPYDIISFWFRR